MVNDEHRKGELMSNAEHIPQHCPAIKKDGQPCAGKPTASGWCVAHDPQANAWRARGGAARSNANRAAKLLPSRLRPIGEELELAFREVHTGILEARTGQAMAAIASALVRVYLAGEQEQRLRDIEASIAEWQRGDRAKWSV
jgi:hypothetical protein